MVENERKDFFLEANSMDELNSSIMNTLNKYQMDCTKLSYYRKDNEGKWQKSKDTEFYNMSQVPDFAFLTMGEQHTDGFSWFASCKRCIDLRNKFLFNIVNRNIINFSDNILQNPRFISFKFKYNMKDGGSLPLMAYLWMGEEYDEEKREFIKRKTLREGAQWYCDHLLAMNIF